MKEKELSVIISGDGSHSIFNSALNEHYHSIHGSIKESQHVFVQAGVKRILEQRSGNVDLLEVGLGTGLNALLTAIYINQNNPERQIRYTALEPYPLSEEIISKLNYDQLLNSTMAGIIMKTIHMSEPDKTVLLANNLSFIKIKERLERVTFTNKFDLVYFDAFAPRVQPELWEKNIFEKLYANMNTGSILVTYCAKGEVKRNLKAAGFEVEALPGPPGKREMTRALKP